MKSLRKSEEQSQKKKDLEKNRNKRGDFLKKVAPLKFSLIKQQ